MIVDVDTAHKISMINVPVLPNNGNNMYMINDPGLPNNGHIISMINVPGLPNICRQFIKESDIIFHWPENTQRRGKYHSAGCLQFIWIRFDLTRDMLLFVCIETTESKPVKQETSCTLILPRVMKIQCNGISPLTLYIVALQIQQKRIK